MSPQSRAIIENTTFEARGNNEYQPGNLCSSSSTVSEIARAADASFALHKIESNASNVGRSHENLLDQDASNLSATTSLRKRASAYLSSSSPEEPSQQFLSSYGSAFLSGIFADIAQASEQDEVDGSDDPASHTGSTSEVTECFGSLQPCKKKSRTSPTTSFGGHTKSYLALSGLTEGAVSGVFPPHIVSPRPNKSANKIQLFNDQVQELQNLAFPSLPHIPATISFSSCTSANVGAVVTPREVSTEVSASDNDSSSAYGWFVSTDADDDDDDTMPNDIPETPFTRYISSPDPDLAFKAVTAPSAENHDVEVQQALAADTIDDVLGDFF